MWSEKLKAFFIHLCISCVVAGGATAAVLIWYPGEYLQLAGGVDLLLLLLAVDAVLGPCLTLIVYHRRKSQKEIFFDFSVIGGLQIAALAYGLWSAYMARPVYLVFEYQRMTVVSAVDVSPEDLTKAPRQWRGLPATGPQLLSLRGFNSATEEYNSVMRAVAGQSQAAQPELWQPYAAARDQIMAVAKPVRSLAEGAVSSSGLARLVKESGVGVGQLMYLPLLARKGEWIMLIDASTADPKGILALEKP